MPSVARAQRDIAGEHVATAGSGAHPDIVGDAGRGGVKLVVGPLPAELHGSARINSAPDDRTLRRAIRVQLGL